MPLDWRRIKLRKLLQVTQTQEMNLKVFKILVVGFGNIGFRHFEGLLKTNLPLNIYIVDPDDKAFNRVNQSYKDGHYDNIKCFMFKTLTNIPSEIDLCI